MKTALSLLICIALLSVTYAQTVRYFNNGDVVTLRYLGSDSPHKGKYLTYGNDTEYFTYTSTAVSNSSYWRLTQITPEVYQITALSANATVYKHLGDSWQYDGAHLAALAVRVA